jgi:hypothetical protein
MQSVTNTLIMQAAPRLAAGIGCSTPHRTYHSCQKLHHGSRKKGVQASAADASQRGMQCVTKTSIIQDYSY